MFDDTISLNPFAAINPKKLLKYYFTKRVRQTYHVFYGGFDRKLDAHAGLFDWATLGISTLIEWSAEKCHEKAQRPDGDLFYIPLAILALPYVASKLARVVASVIATAICFLGIIAFHIGAQIINCCIDPKAAKKAEKTLNSPARLQQAVGDGLQGLVASVQEIGNEAVSPQDRTHAVENKASDLLDRGIHKIEKRAKGAAHKVNKETKKFLKK